MNDEYIIQETDFGPKIIENEKVRLLKETPDYQIIASYTEFQKETIKSYSFRPNLNKRIRTINLKKAILL